MEHMEDIWNHTANLETIEAIRHFRGYAKIDISHLQLKKNSVLSSRPLGQNVEGQNALRLLKIFESVGCDREDHGNYVPVLINQNTLNQAINDSRTTQDMLLSGIEPPNLILKHDTSLLCLQGKSRLRAAQEFFPPGERWWGARLYLDSLPAAARDRLREKYSNEQNFSDGDIYRNLRCHQLRGNVPRAESWWARWSSEKCWHVRQMQKQVRLLTQFDQLLPYIGLWASVNVKLFGALLAQDESNNYLEQICKVWSVFSCDAAALVDAQSVYLLEGLMSVYSLVDQKHIQDLMNNREIFPALMDSERRSNILECLLQTFGRILFLHTFSQDWLYLELPGRALRGLLSKTFEGSVRNAMLKKYVNTGNSCIIQTSAADYKTASGDLKVASHMLYVQLWLCAIRLFVIPLRDSHTSENVYAFFSIRGLPLLTDQAKSLDFTSMKIEKLSHRDINNDTCRYFMEHMCQVELYEPDPNLLRQATCKIRHILKQLHKGRKIADEVPAFKSPFHEEHPSGSLGTPVEQPTLLIEPTAPSGPNKPTVPQALGFEDFSGEVNKKLDIVVNRSTEEMLKAWHASPNNDLIVFYMFFS
ncbi:hypothetical protein AJ78_06702 [Emergomyces pasteurianus Ep9510]|uniref:Uncharacterized protein n=1 Tax=Emergomyces pasteurianus Ep9510 TaxID=1447872 RepID=A0A1J9P9Z3_9EURO|nr:hypothetical protein AJ78_06702 [Emergomyces pasteurianus Ep9510]